MKIAVIGAGGVGGYYGALLTAAGNEVHFVARGAHLQAMRTGGLKIRSVLGDFRVQPIQATDQPDRIGDVDLVLFCTKTFAIEDAARQSKALVAPRTTVLGLQNGVEAAAQLGEILGSEHVLAAATWLSSAIEAPGVIRHASDSRRIVLGELDGANSERAGEIQSVFSKAGLVAEVSSNIQGVLWSKLVFISAVAGFGSLTRLPMDAYRGVPAARGLLVAEMQEVAAVATALGIRLEVDAVEKALEYIDAARPGIKASMQLDMEAGRPSELDAIIGVVVRKGRETGTSTPVASTLYALLLPIELSARLDASPPTIQFPAP